MDSYRLILQIRCALFFQQHANNTYTVEDVRHQCSDCASTAEQILDDLCELNIVEQRRDGMRISYRYKAPNSRIINHKADGPNSER